MMGFICSSYREKRKKGGRGGKDSGKVDRKKEEARERESEQA